MTDSAHIFNPLDNSLAERIKAYRKVRESWFNIEASLKFTDDPEWSQTLGESKELEEAHEVILKSMKLATASLSIEDIDRAKEQGLMNDNEASEFMSEKMSLQQFKTEVSQGSSFKS